MGTAPEEIRSDIDQTRAELSRNVDRLADRTDPRRTAQRGAERVRRAAHRLRERAKGTGSENTQTAGETQESTPEQAARRAQGHPLVIGLLGFGAGLLAASALQWVKRGGSRTGMSQRGPRRPRVRSGRCGISRWG